MDPRRRLPNSEPIQDSMDEKDEPSAPQSLFKLATCAVCGGVFGIALEKGRVFEPLVIQDQMMMRRFIMMKMFLSALATSMFSLSLMSMIPATEDAFRRAKRNYILGFFNKGFVSSLIGGAVLGAGMTVSGACPGMVLAQVGAGVSSSVWTLAGCASGAVAYGLLEPVIVRLTKPSQPYKQHFLAETQSTSYVNLALPMAAIVSVAVFAIELLAPWKNELKVAHMGGPGLMATAAWPPYVAGMMIGLLQVPLVLVVLDTLGGSSGYCTMVSQGLVSRSLRQKFSYLSNFRTGLGNWWQVALMSGVVGGAYISSKLSSTYSLTAGVSREAGFVGGMLMIVGARLASGCTSGHGISGMSLLSLLSLVTVPAMFAGGMLTAAIMNVA